MGDLFLEKNDLIETLLENGRLVVRFVSPANRNSLSTPVLQLLEMLISKCELAEDLEEVIFTGADDVFASGADLREIARLSPETARQFSIRGQSIMDRISKLRQRTTAAINGYCYGGGLDLALACDRRIASTASTFCHPGVGLGIITGWGGTQRLPRLIGVANTLEVFYTACPISAKRGLEIGLIDELVDSMVW